MRPNELTIKEINTADAWDRYVFSHEKAGYGHLFNWTQVIWDAYHHKPIYLAAVKTPPKACEQICGILPLFRFKRFTGRPKLASIPFFDTSGILARDQKAQTFLFKNATIRFPPKLFSGMELRQNSALKIPDLKISGELPHIYTAKTGMLIDLPGSQGNLLKSFKSKLRSQIHKGRKNGLVWRIGKKELLDPFYKVFSRNMRDLGSPVHSKKFFAAIFNHFYHHSFICVIFYRSKPVAASFMFRFKKRLANPWASSLREWRHLNSNIYLYWQMIKFACNMGMDIFDMGRSSSGASTYRFKKQWGPRENQLFWYSWGGKKCCGRMNETLSIEPWKKMPMGLANLLGPLVRKNISL